MSFLAILLLACGLAVDATAVSAARGVAVQKINLGQIFLVASLFGGFQALMPLLGYLLGEHLGESVQAWDHWIAFGLLAAIGSKMLWEAWRPSEKERSSAAPLAFSVLLVLALATSIDAFAAGVALPLLDAPLALSLATIGISTAVLSALGLLAGRCFGAVLGQRMEAFGGVVLIALGVKILSEHLGA